MKLIYYKGAHPNFGDDLNALLWPRLEPSLFEADDSQGFLGIGTIIGMKAEGVSRLHVFSSGVGYSPLTGGPQDRRLWCVRGPLSARQLGADDNVALTDGAILSPRVLPAPATAGPPVVVPHWETMLAGGWENACAQAGFTLIDPMLPPQAVIPAIAAAPLVITESLHGAIIADTYGVPWVAFATTGNFSTFKWLDWTRSIQAPLRVHLVPPPDAAAILRFGRSPLGGWGTLAKPDEAVAMAEFEIRSRPAAAPAPPSAAERLKATAKAVVRDTPMLKSLLGYNATRTAEALGQLASEAPTLSDAAHRDRLADDMSERLRRLAREQVGYAA